MTKTKKTKEEQSVITTNAGTFVMQKEILEVYLRDSNNDKNALLNRFSYQEVNDNYTFFEHLAIGSTSGIFFGNPFMGAFKADEQWKAKTRKSRIANALFGLLLYRRDNDRHCGSAGNPPTTSPQTGQKLCYTFPKALMYEGNKIDELVNVFEVLYRSKDTETPFSKVYDVRLVLAPTQFDENMVAYPNPLGVEFVDDSRNILTVSQDSRLLSILKPRDADVELADVIKDRRGEHHIGRTSSGNEHRLYFCDKKSWEIEYKKRITEELTGLEHLTY